MSNSDMAHLAVDVTDFCSASGCPEFVVWDFGYRDCYSCKLVGQSHFVDAVPKSCLKLSEITSWINATTPVSETSGQQHIVMFEMTTEGYKNAKQYLDAIGRLEGFERNKTSLDGFSLIAFANSILAKEE